MDGPPKTLTLGPLTYFQSHCARCHGAYGSFYTDSLGKLTSEAISKKVDEMARGPGASVLNESDLAAQVAFHQSLPDGVFVSVGQVEAGMVSGEVTVGGEVVLIGRFGRVTAEVEGHVWRCRIEDAAAFVVEARAGGQTMTLDPRQIAYGRSNGR